MGRIVRAPIFLQLLAVFHRDALQLARLALLEKNTAKTWRSVYG